MLEIGDIHKAVQRRAIDTLATIAQSGDARVVAMLRDRLTSDDRRLRWSAAYALAQIGASAFAMDIGDALCEALSDDDGDIRWAATDLIVRLGRENPAEIRERLLALAAHDNRNARKMALYCIRDLAIDDPQLLTVVERSARDSDVHVRLAALNVLARLSNSSDTAARIILDRLETDSDPGVRRAAAAALGNVQIATPRVVAALKNAAADSADQSLARAAQSALDRLEKIQ